MNIFMPIDHLQRIAKPLLPAGPDDWLSHNIEKGQSKEQYRDAVDSRPIKLPGAIYLYPYFDSTPFEEHLMQVAAGFLTDYFSVSVRVSTRPPEPKLTPYNKFKHDIGCGKRVASKDILFAMRPTRDGLPSDHIPSDGHAHILVTDYDLWYEPDDQDDWLFGLAGGDGRAVVSTARLMRTHSTECIDFARFLKILSHEVGHTLHFAHCIDANCNMNGTNSLNEVDLHPIELCPYCLRKLYLLSPFNPLNRVSRLIATLTDIGVDLTDDYFYLEKRLLETN